MKYLKYSKDDSALTLVRVFNAGKKERLKRAYELKFAYTQELDVLLNLIQKKHDEIKLMTERAQHERENETNIETLMYIN
jgi:hypothetical protein